MSRAILVDLHVHTSFGSLDSRLGPDAMVGAARARGLNGVAATEHFRIWSERECREASARGVMVFPGAEVSTDLGHVLVFGPPRFPRARTLAGLAEETGAIESALVAAHPFRGALDSPHHWLSGVPRSELVPAAAERLRGLVHAIEVANSGCTAEENALALELARRLALPAVGGSDAHSEAYVGAESTAFARMPRTSGELAAALRAGTGIGPGAAGAGAAPRTPGHAEVRHGPGAS